MSGGEPGEGDGEGVFGEAQRDIGERLGGWSDGSAKSGLASVSSQGDGGPEGGGEELLGGSELASGSVGEERGDGDANKGVEGAPD